MDIVRSSDMQIVFEKLKPDRPGARRPRLLMASVTCTYATQLPTEINITYVLMYNKIGHMLNLKL